MATEQQGATGQADDLTPPVALTPEIVADIRRRAERRDRKGWEYSTVPVEALYALCDAADELARERRRTAALQAGLERLRNAARSGIEGMDTAEVLDVIVADADVVLADDAPGRTGGEGEGQ